MTRQEENRELLKLFAPLRKLDDAALVLVDGRVEEAESWKRCSPPSGGRVISRAMQRSCSSAPRS